MMVHYGSLDRVIEFRQFTLMKKLIYVIIILITSFILVRYGLFGLYKSYDTPIIALLPSILGVIAIVLIKCPMTMIGTSFGYILSFVLAQIMKTEYIDSERGNALYSNWFELWFVIYSGIIIICFIIDLYRNKKHIE